MLMSIKAKKIASIEVFLTFDDGTKKDCIIAVGDLVSVVYNANGMRKAIDGKVVKISAVGEDPNGWYIIVDSSDDFDSAKAKFSPMSILDIEIIRKGDTIEEVRTPIGSEAVPYIRIVKGRLQYSVDSKNWRPIHIDKRDVIEPQSGTVPMPPHPHHPPKPSTPTEDLNGFDPYVSPNDNNTIEG